jgi:8-oxo-dGTP pyrophosphatase MutT (NUDIX family)
MSGELRQAALSLVSRPDGRLLAISRGRDTSNWGLPGGSVEHGETLEMAARRELLEETGVRAERSAVAECVYHARSKTSHTFVFTYFGQLWLPDQLYSDPFEGFVSWLEPRELLSPGCEFRGFTEKLFHCLGIRI